jgi:hypothetical protein
MSLLIPSHVRISRAINLPEKTSRSIRFIEDTAQWRLWHPFFKSQSVQNVLDQNHVSWKTVLENDSIFSISLTQNTHRPVLNTWQLHALNNVDSVALQWYMDFHLAWYPWEKFSSLFYEKTYGAMMEQGLYDMKSTLVPE